MSLENARSFLEVILQNEDLAEKFKGFTFEEFKQAVNEYNLSIKKTENLKVSGTKKAIPI